IASRQVLSTGDLIGKHRGQQILCFHSLKLSRDFLAAATPRNRQSPCSIPSPAHLEHWSRKRSLNQEPSNGMRTQISEHLFELEAVSRAKRQDNCILRRRSLKLEVESTAEPFPQRQPPGAIQSASERRVYHQLLTPALIEESLDYQRLLSRHHTERSLRG